MWVVWEIDPKSGKDKKIDIDFDVRYAAEQWILKNQREGYIYDILPLADSIRKEITNSKRRKFNDVS